MEKEGREQRYRLLREACSEQHTSDVLVAHHGDDQIETFFMRLFRGSGIAGLACMKQIQTMDDGTRRIRPLLYQSKASLEATCKERNVPFVLDPSNLDLTYDRNRIRSGVQQLKSNGSLQGPMLLEAIAYFQSVRFYCRCCDRIRFAKGWNWRQSDTSSTAVNTMQTSESADSMPPNSQKLRSPTSLPVCSFVFHSLQCCGGSALESAARRHLRSERSAVLQRLSCETRR